MDIVYTDHLEKRLNLRKFPKYYPVIILNNSEKKFFDSIEHREIAVKRLKYNKNLEI